MIVVTVVTQRRSPLAAALRTHAQQSRITLTVVSAARFREMRAPADNLIVDLTTSIDPPELPHGRALSGWIALVLPDRGTIPAAWLPWLAQPHVHCVVVQEHGSRFEPVIHLIMERALARQRDLAAHVLRVHPLLAPLRTEVDALLASPWTIRRPRDLAAACHLTLGGLKRRVQALGITRVEHFITLVRWVALEYLAAIRHVAPRQARASVGIADVTNFKRQCARVQIGDAVDMAE